MNWVDLIEYKIENIGLNISIHIFVFVVDRFFGNKKCTVEMSLSMELTVISQNVFMNEHF